MVDRDAAAEVAGLEEDTGLFDGGGHAVSVLRGDAERLFDEHVLACGRGGGDERLVLIGFGADDNAVDGAVVPDGVDVVEGGRAELVAAGFGASRVAVPDGDGVDIGAGLQALTKPGVWKGGRVVARRFSVSVWLPLLPAVGTVGRSGSEQFWAPDWARVLSVADRRATRYRAARLRVSRGTMATLAGLASGACFAGAVGSDSISFAARRQNSVAGQSSIQIDRNSDNWKEGNSG